MQVAGDVVETQQDVVAPAVSVGGLDADHAAAEVGDADPQLVVLQRVERRLAPVRHAPKRFGG